MNRETFLFPILLGSAALYFFIAALVRLRKDYRARTESWLLVYLIASGIWTLAESIWQLGWLPSAGSPLFERLPTYGVLLLSLLFLYLTQAFFQVEETNQRWWRIGVIWITILIFFDVGFVLLAQFGSAWGRLRSEVVLGILAGWLFFSTTTIRAVFHAFRQTENRPLHRNRIRYWILALALNMIAGALIFAEALQWGRVLFLLATVLATYTMLTYQLLDMRLIMRRITSHLLATLISGLLFLAGMGFYFYWQSLIPDHSPIIVGAGLAMFLVLLFNPILGLSNRLVEWSIGREIDQDPNRMLREYSLTISNVVNLTQLELVGMRLITDVLEINTGTLLLVDLVMNGDGRPCYELHRISGVYDENERVGTLAADSHVVTHLVQDQQPLTQYDLDLNPAFQDVPPEEQAWLSDLNLEVYVPVLSQGNWIGLIGLGSKLSGDSYSDNDLLLLSTLADQTAVALENARLFTDLSRLNDRLQHAYKDLEEVNRRLQESDTLKSDFIGVVTHEMRTPLANVTFALDQFHQDGVNSLTSAQQESLQKITDGVKTSEQMINNLVTFATFLSKQGELHYEAFPFDKLLEEVLRPLHPLAEKRNVVLKVKEPETAVGDIHADRERLADAIHHLVHNAIKFSNEEEEVTIRTARKNNTLILEVRDTGVGIPPEQMENLWHGFTQMADPVRRGVEGLGLGLPLVRYVALAHKGDVYVLSEEGVGSTFGLQIPVANHDGLSLTADGK